MKSILAALLAIPAACAFLGAQPAQRVDSGTLTVTSTTPMGTRVSTEEFTVLKNADGGFTMTTIVSGGRQMRSVLTTDSTGATIAYEHHGRGGEAVEKTITSKRDESGVLVISELSSRNPPLPPFRLPQKAMLFGDGGLSQLWFLGLGPVPREVSYVLTGRWTANVATVSNIGPEAVVIEGTPVAASHLVLGEGALRREVWLDSRKRLLKVAVGTTTVAVRTTLPK